MAVNAEEDQFSIKEENKEIVEEDFSQSEYSISTPYTIVWTPLPLLTWILPFIGHTGITE